jgi:hypothetical protein
MTGSDYALIIGSVASLVTAISAAAVVIIKAQKENTAAIEKVQETANETHIMVNSQREAAAKYTKVLVDALRAKGIEVPDDESLD